MTFLRALDTLCINPVLSRGIPTDKAECAVWRDSARVGEMSKLLTQGAKLNGRAGACATCYIDTVGKCALGRRTCQMKKRYLFAYRNTFAAALFCVLLIAGCSLTVKPDTIPTLREYGKVSLSGATLLVTNAEKDSSVYEIRNQSGAKWGITANRFVWSKMLVQALAGEFAWRGAQVQINAPLTLSVAISEIVFNQYGKLCQLRVVVSILSSTGWSRDYEGIAEARPGAFESMAVLVNRLAGEALAEAIKSLLRDDDFLTQLRHKE